MSDTNPKDLIGDLFSKLLKTPMVMEQIKNNLMNRDVSIKVDGKEYQISKKQSEDELEKLKKENFEIRSLMLFLLYEIEKIQPVPAHMTNVILRTQEILGLKK